MMFISFFLYPSSISASQVNYIDLKDIPIRDPQILLRNDIYFMTGTTATDGVKMFSSTDLESWKDEGYVLQNYPSWASHHWYAPEMIFDGMYYMAFASRQENGKHGIGIVKSVSPIGSFIDPVGHPITPINVSCLDGNIFNDGGKKYMVYVIDDNNHWKIVIQELSNDYLRLVGEPKTIIETGDAWTAGLTEGPSLINYQGRYWLFWSSFSVNGYGIRTRNR